MTPPLPQTTAVAVAAFALSAWWWPSLPDPMPTHWGAGGLPDGFGPRWVGALLLPATMLLLPPFLLALTRIDPRQDHAARIQRPLGHVLVGTQAFLFVIHALTLKAATTPGHALDEGVFIAALGALFVVVGNALGKTSSNWFFGIRTPWTLHSEAVWHRTHRAAGWAYALAGLATIVVAAAASGPARVFVPLGMILGASAFAVVFSWVAWRQEQARAA